ncbi:cell wall hydrolase [Paracoccus rhizosphaerae]|uniref:Cell wall hydrolase n=1 Tax=Paracoccus rhizosphaerae TaxID=1133347 RepID=A0ABV6CHX9_9RHOB|nr:cell wall hydrolase [Paracoccus rhizosphaerae]
MSRAIFATVVALVVACSSGALIFARFDGGHDRNPPASLEERRTHHLPERGAATLPTAALKPLRPAARPSLLALRVARAPAPRPTKVHTLRPFPRPATPEQILRGAPVPLPPTSLRNASELSCIAVAIYHEARDQDEFGQRAVASVILQRAAVPHRWGDTACDNVVPTQFAFLTSRYDYPPIDDMRAWGTAVRFAARALLEGPLPELEGADHYHTTSVSPGWAPAMDRVRRIDDHVFYVDPRSSSPL